MWNTPHFLFNYDTMHIVSWEFASRATKVVQIHTNQCSSTWCSSTFPDPNNNKKERKKR